MTQVLGHEWVTPVGRAIGWPSSYRSREVFHRSLHDRLQWPISCFTWPGTTAGSRADPDQSPAGGAAVRARGRPRAAGRLHRTLRTGTRWACRPPRSCTRLAAPSYFIRCIVGGIPAPWKHEIY